MTHFGSRLQIPPFFDAHVDEEWACALHFAEGVLLGLRVREKQASGEDKKRLQLHILSAYGLNSIGGFAPVC
jgi:hypothetical protein